MLKSKGHKVTVFIHDLSISKDTITFDEDIRIVRFAPTKTGTENFLGYSTCLSYEYAHIVKLFIENEGQPDIVESQEYLGIGYYLQQFKLLGYRPFSELTVLVTCHAPSFLCLEYNQVPVYQFPDYWVGQMEKNSMLSADILISPSRYFVQQAKERMPWGDIQETYLRNPIVTQPDAEPSEFESNYIVAFGKLSPLKGSFQLLEQFRQLWDEGFPHPLHIVGSTNQIFHPERLTMGDLVNRKYKNYIAKGLLKLHGELSPDGVKMILRKSHVVIVPSLVDNLPYTVLEAMSWGNIVLGSCQGGQSEIIKDGVNGFLFDHFKAGDFKNKLLHILGLNNIELRLIGKRAIADVHAECSYSNVYEKKILLIKDFIRKATSRKLFPFLNSLATTIPVPQSEENSLLLSIVVPYYNMGMYIDECVRSVMESEYTDKELIIVDDGSDEIDSINKLKDLERKYPVSVLRKKNSGLAEARNFGAKNARGKFIAFLDADDTIEKTYYTKAMVALNRYDNVHFVGCWTKYFGASKNCWPTFNPEPPYLLLHNMVNSSALVFKRESYLQYGLNDNSFLYGLEDWDSVINMVAHNCGGVVLPELLFNYRVRKGSMARKFTRVKLLYLNFLISRKYSELFKTYAVEISSILQANGSGLNFDNPTLDLPGEFYIPFLPGKWQEKLKRKIKQSPVLKNIAYYIYKKIKK